MMRLDRSYGSMLFAALLGCSSAADTKASGSGGSSATAGAGGRATGGSGAAGGGAVGGMGGHGGGGDGGTGASARAGVGGKAEAAGGASGASGASAGRAGGSAGNDASTRCSGAALTWKTGNKTTYTSYPEPGSDECIKFSGCEYEGMFAACDGVKSEAWVSAHNIVAIFPDLSSHQLHDLCLRERDGSKPIIVTVYDTCGDADCDGCCTQNRGSADALIDVEHYTDQRWGVADGRIEWADLGPTTGAGCDGK